MTQSAEKVRAAQVIVVGAGPVGLLTALGLAREGIGVLVLESGAGISRSPRALTYTPVVLEALDDLGVLEAARKVALRCGRVQWQFQDNGQRLEFDVAALGDLTRFPFNLHMGQDTLAEIVVGQLSGFPNVSIRWDTRLESYSQQENTVVLEVVTPAGRETLAGEWLIGADGARSTVRQLAGLEFEGFTWPDRYVATNVSYDFARKGYGPAIFLLDPRNWALIARVDQGSLWRVTYGEPATLPEETAGQRARGRVEQFTGDPDFEIVHASPYRVHERAATNFRLGRVLLAGDAAHVVNPLGGQGLTAGIMDARELSELLAGHLKGRYGDGALDYYAQERKRTFTEVSTKFSTATKRLVQEADPEQRRRDEATLRQGMEDRSVMQQRMHARMMVRGRPYQGP